MSKILTSNDKVLASNNRALEYENAPPSIAETTSILKGNGSGDAVAATEGVDYIGTNTLQNYLSVSNKGVANGLATLDANGKVPANQLNPVFVISSTAPTDTSVLWIDSSTSIMKYYYNNAWHPIVPTWG